ncbi:MAG: ligase-associated DNA damage response exonuclease, partial [Bacteroidetes bacterium]
MLEITPRGMYCPQADVYIDPWKPVPRALITHAHSDHARWGMDHYLSHKDTLPVLRQRLGDAISVQGVAYGETLSRNGVQISFHPAGHVPGSAQIRLAYRGEVWVVSGDYKMEDDGLSTPFEAVRCHTFITESTFGLPVYRWQPQALIMEEIRDWWRQNIEQGKASLLAAYALGKAQRILANLGPDLPGPVYIHGAIASVNEVLQRSGYALPQVTQLRADLPKKEMRRALVLAPPQATDTPWTRKLGPLSLGVASGWMSLRGARRRRAADRGFALSDHADWEGLNAAVTASGAQRVLVTHGYTDVFARHLREKGLDAEPLETLFEGDEGEQGSGNSYQGT